MQARIERELAGGQEEEQEVGARPVVGVAAEGRVQVGEPEGAEQMTDEVIEWMARQLVEDEGKDVEKLKVTFTTEGQEEEVEVVMEGEEDMPDLLTMDECREIEEEFGEGSCLC